MGESLLFIITAVVCAAVGWAVRTPCGRPALSSAAAISKAKQTTVTLSAMTALSDVKADIHKLAVSFAAEAAAGEEIDYRLMLRSVQYALRLKLIEVNTTLSSIPPTSANEKIHAAIRASKASPAKT